MARTIIGSTWNRDNRNGINNNFEELYKNREFIDGKVTDYTKLVNDSIKFYQRDSLSTRFEMGGFTTASGAGGNNTDNTARIRQTSFYFLKTGMMINPQDSIDYEYNIHFWNDDGFDETSGWFSFKNSYRIKNGRIARILIRRSDNGIVSQTDLDNVNRLFGDIEINNEVFNSMNIKFELGSIFTSGNIVTDGVTDNLISTHPVLLSKGFTVGLHDYEKFNLNIAYFDPKTGDYKGSLGRGVEELIVEEYGLYYITLGKIDGTPITAVEIEEAERLVFIGYGLSTMSIDHPGRGKFIITDDINHEFKAFKEHSFGNAEARNTSAQDIEDLFTNLSNTSNGYVKKKNLGNSVNGKPLYEITLNAHRTDSRESIPHSKPKIVIIGSLHGNEKTPAFSIYNLVNLLTHHWHENKMLEFLRFNVDLKIIPLTNPDGFDSETRMNANGIDLNRDFPADWVNITSGSSTNGDAPLSQPESQIIYNWLSNHQDAVLGIDYHNSLYDASLEFACWAGTLTENNAKVMQNVISLMGRHWQLEYPQFPQDITHQFGDVRSSSNGTLTRQMTDYGIPGITLECLREVPWQDNPEIFDELATTMALELLIYTLKHNIKLIM